MNITNSQTQRGTVAINSMGRRAMLINPPPMTPAMEHMSPPYLVNSMRQSKEAMLKTQEIQNMWMPEEAHVALHIAEEAGLSYGTDAVLCFAIPDTESITGVSVVSIKGINVPLFLGPLRADHLSGEYLTPWVEWCRKQRFLTVRHQAAEKLMNYIARYCNTWGQAHQIWPGALDIALPANEIETPKRKGRMPSQTPEIEPQILHRLQTLADEFLFRMRLTYPDKWRMRLPDSNITSRTVFTYEHERTCRYGQKED